MQSGTKLVLLLAGLALALGGVSWWNRFALAHRSTDFWGAENARLIVEPEDVQALLLAPVDEDTELAEPSSASPVTGYGVTSQADLTGAPGLAHLSYALTSDSNYDWDTLVPQPPLWQWVFRFRGDQQEVLILFNEEFNTVGKLLPDSTDIEIVSCAPMAETLREYFLAKKSGLLSTSDADASKPAE